jgi:hypothetical protein
MARIATTRHSDRVLYRGRYPQRPVGRNNPGAARGCDRHHAGSRPGQLGARMIMRFDPRAIDKIFGHAGKRPWRVLVIIPVGALHLAALHIVCSATIIGRTDEIGRFM